MSTYKDAIKHVANIPDDVFPDFLFKTLKNDFGDGYYTKSLVKDDLSAMISGLKRRYSDFFAYSEAMTIYNEYMERLVEKYGSLSIVKNAIKAGLMEDPVPPKPKLKNNKKNRQFLRAGITPSRRVETDVVDEEIRRLARAMFPDKTGETVDEADRYKKLDKTTKKMLKRREEKMAGWTRRQNLYRTSTTGYGADFIVEYLNQVTKGGRYNEVGKRTSEMSLLEIIQDEEKYASLPPELVEDELKAGKSIIENGRLIYARDAQRMQIMKDLYGIGIDVIGTYGKSMNKQAVKMLRSTIGDTEPMTKKELKKLKKKMKRDRELIERRRDNDRLLEKTLLSNKFDFSRTGETLQFRLKDLYRD